MDDYSMLERLVDSTDDCARLRKALSAILSDIKKNMAEGDTFRQRLESKVISALDG